MTRQDGRVVWPWKLLPAQASDSRAASVYWPGLRWVNEFIDWRDGKRLVFIDWKCLLPLRLATLTLAMVPLGNQQCELRMLLEYRPWFGVFGRMLDALLFRHMLRRALIVWQKRLEREARRSGAGLRARESVTVADSV